jgi:Icc protein
MPISLKPISRRNFLKGSLAASATMLAPPWLRAQESKPDPHRFALFSDTHIHVDTAFVHKSKVAETTPWKNFQQVCNEVLALPQRPSAVIINGDCACQAGLPGDYMTLVEGLAPLRAANLPIHLALGNHDHRENFWEVLPADEARKRDVEDHHSLFIPAPRANFFILDSLEATEKTPGLVGSKQLAWLASTLDANADKPSIIFVHHNPDQKTEKISGIQDTRAFYDVILPRKQVKAYIFGHTHDWKREELEGIHLINLPPVAWIFKEGRPNGWVDLNLQANGATFELRTLDPKHPLNGEKYDLKWR